jgi:hypothetical protein
MTAHRCRVWRAPFLRLAGKPGKVWRLRSCMSKARGNLLGAPLWDWMPIQLIIRQRLPGRLERNC